MKTILEKEKEKYNIIHKQSGFDVNQNGYGRQRDLIKNSSDYFYSFIREHINNSCKLLEIGVGAGEQTLFFLEKGLEFNSIDISDFVITELTNLHPDLKDKISVASASDIPFGDDQFDLVLHLDGMEHIPVELEIDCLKESIRSTKKYVCYGNACGVAYWDQIVISHGLGPAHCNLKNESEWVEFYENYKDQFGYILKWYDFTDNTFRIILEKNNE
tara:strand:+ start:864 stop:1511 length:648 start_codon:yes stop_codon:yes gene_type:complete